MAPQPNIMHENMKKLPPFSWREFLLFAKGSSD
jgi:hypothetical protein